MWYNLSLAGWVMTGLISFETLVLFHPLSPYVLSQRGEFNKVIRVNRTKEEGHSI